MTPQGPQDVRPFTERRLALRMQQPLPKATLFDRIVFLFGLAAALWIAVLISIRGFESWSGVWLIIPVWAILAYIALPRLHRLLTDLYVPDYFIGRTRTADGLLGDPVNLACDGTIEQLDATMMKAGWNRADEITLRSTWGIIVSTLTKKSYPTAPVSPLMLFGRRHDVAYQQEVSGSAKQRHHVRFWHCPPGWLLPGGARVDWLGAATFDTDVGVSLFTLQVTHRIDSNTDVERDFVVDSATASSPDVSVRVLEDFTTGYHARNGGGDLFITDGNLPIIDVNEVDAPPIPTPSVKTDLTRRPLSTVMGVAAVLFATLVGVVEIFQYDFTAPLRLSELEHETFIAVVSVVAGIYLLEVILAVRVLFGGYRSRIVLLALLTVTILLTAITYLSGEVRLALDWTLLVASLQAGAMVAFSSGATAEFAAAHAERKARKKLIRSRR